MLFVFVPTLAYATTYDVYVAPMPKKWESNFKDVLPTAIQFWKENNPNLDFNLVSSPEQSDFVVQWASTYKDNVLGYWTPNTVNDYGKPYISVTLGFFEDDNWVLVDWKYATVITAHELGHAMGLPHNNNPNSIMYPTLVDYNFWKANIEENIDSRYFKKDTQEIKELELDKLQSKPTDNIIISPSDFVFHNGDYVTIIGMIKPSDKIKPVDLSISDPQGKEIYTHSFVPDKSGNIQTKIFASGAIWNHLGVYQIFAKYEDHVATSSFLMLGGLNIESKATNGNITLNGKKYTLNLRGTGVTVQNISVDTDSNSLILDVKIREEPRLIEVLIPRQLFDSRINNQDSKFVIISGDGNDLQYSEPVTSDDARFLLFQVPPGEISVKIVGTSFGNQSLDKQTDNKKITSSSSNGTSQKVMAKNQTPVNSSSFNSTNQKQPTISSDSKKIASFVDPKKDPQSYVKRYQNEPTYKIWFDKNYGSQYKSIYEAVGLHEPSKSITDVKKMTDAKKAEKIKIAKEKAKERAEAKKAKK